MRKVSTRIIFNPSGNFYISPSIWPGPKLRVQPGDLSKFAPCGSGVYGYQDQKGSNPFMSAPSQEECGGIIYFGNDITKADFTALMRIMGVQSANVTKPKKDFAVFTAASKQPGKDGYLVQMRIVSKFGLRYMFSALADDEYEKFPEQKITMVEAMWSFLEQERERWGTSWMDDKGLGGKFGGDGDLAREELAFGFILENEYHSVYRIWSRAWLVTK